MKLSGEHRFDASPDAVWQALLDPDKLAATLPGCDRLELVGEDTYEGDLDIKVGPVQGKFQGRVELSDIDPQRGYSMKVSGQGAPGFVNATARIVIEADGDGTRLTYDGDAQVGGRVASVGQRLLESSAKSIVRQSLEGLDSTLAAGAGSDESDAGPAAASQSQVAARVARDVAGDLLPRPLLIVLAALLVLLILYFLLR